MMKDNEKDSVMLYGAGGHCRVVIDILKASGIPISGIVDDHPDGDEFMGFPLSTPNGHADNLLITIGDGKIRRRIFERFPADNYPIAIHPSAIVAPNAIIGEGTVIVHGAVVQSSAKIGSHCIINTNSSVGHDCIIHDFVHIASGVTVCGGVEIGEGSWIGAGSVIRQGIKIGRNCMIGIGSAVVKDIPDNVTAYGNPCRVISSRD